MHSPKRIKITDVNPHLICVLCGGYYIDATTIIECLHSFCKSCIVRYLQKNKYCPICDVQVHKTAPLLNIRSDKTLQNIVYKLVPSLFKNEMERRVAFYEKYPGALPALPEQRGEVTDSTPIFFPDELLIICLEYQMDKNSEQVGNPWPKRYLHCPAAITVSHLVKLIRGKFGLSQIHHVSLFFKDDLLQDDITIMDIAYTYQCRRKMPIHLMYRILEVKKKTIRLMPPIPPAKLDSATQSDFVDEEKKDLNKQAEMKDKNDTVQSEKTDGTNVVQSKTIESGAVPFVNNKQDKRIDDCKEVEMKVQQDNDNKENSSSDKSSDQIMQSANDNDVNKCVLEKSDKSEVTSKSKDNSVENKVEQVASATEAGTSSEGAWKEVQLQISENGVMSVRNMKSSECSPIPAVEAPNCPVSHPTTTSQASSVVASKVSFAAAHRNTEPIVSVSKVSKDQVKKEVNHTLISANDNKLSISRVTSPAGGMPAQVPVAKGDVLNRIVSKLSPNETVIGNTGVTIRPVTKVYPGMKSIQERKNRGPPSNHIQSRYKAITQAPTWNPTIDRTTMLTLKQNSDLNKPPRFFKMRNTPRYLGNPAEGVKPIYGGGRQEDSPSKQSPPKSPVKQPPPYTPRGQDKPPPPYTPRPAHTSCGGTAAAYLPPNPYHLLYSGFPFSGASPELIRSMCASTAYHPSLPPSISMLYNNPGLQQSPQRSQPPPPPPPPHDFKGATSTPPSIQRIPSSLSPKSTPQSIDDKKRDHSPASTSTGTSKSHKPQEDKPSALLSLPPPPPIPLPPPPPASPSDKSSSSLTINNNTKESLLSTTTINHHTLK